jgi:hypothetical protein
LISSLIANFHGDKDYDKDSNFFKNAAAK